MFSSMDHPIILLLLLTYLATQSLALAAQSRTPKARITVVGAVYCDTCSTNTFSRSSYFLPGVDVLIKCKFRGNSPKTAEDINFEVNRTTDKYGVYKLEIPVVDGVNCIDGFAMKSMCQANLIGSSSSACNVPGLKTTADEISVKSKQDNLCIYSMNALSFRPSKKNVSLCGDKKEELASSFNSSKFFLPYFPPYGFFPRPQLPFPPLPPLSSLPFPPLPPLPSLPFPFPPSLPFPFPQFPPFTPSPNPLAPNSPPAFNFGDPRTWIPYIPPFTPSPNPLAPNSPPAFNFGDPRTWIPYIPKVFAPPPPPAFNLRDPRTWIPPYIPPSPPGSPQNQKP